MNNKNNALVFEGMISVRAVIESKSREIAELYYDSERAKKHAKELAWLRHRGEESGFPVLLCPREKIDEIAGGNSHGGVCAVCGERNIETVKQNDVIPCGFYIMLCGIEDPFNFGFAVRSAYAAGADGVILPERSWMDSAGTVCRSSAGTSERIAMFNYAEDTLDIFRSAGYAIVAAEIDDSVSMWDADLEKPLLLIIGGERRGISRGILDKCDRNVRIDYSRAFGGSLSAASAAAILCFEIARQNREK